MQLYTFFRSSAAFRVRIALNLKGLDWQAVPVHLRRGGGEQHQAAFLAVNPAGKVPALVDEDEVLTQSLAIIEYLDETRPEPPLLPAAPLERARVRAIAQTIACDIHPLGNLGVLRYLKRELGAGDDARDAWSRHWVEQGLAAVEQMLVRSPHTGLFCHGDTPTLADCCLVPQVFNARRVDCDLDAMPTLRRIAEHCLTLAAFCQAAPQCQGDADVA
ncbi:maleylacetoacetate isomerase [Amphibiibacter pelophylacis]|uniref:Maleylacetoacetate isomerase n=1 Tax=Amphibiibacter pelophylacis TaxID=1799477 RepID=A0ACC6P0A9_9BURK